MADDALAQVKAALAADEPVLELVLVLAPGEPLPTELVALTELLTLRLVCPGRVELPRWFGRLRGLSSLEIDGELEAIPPWIAELDTLELVELRCAGGFEPALAELPALHELTLALGVLGEVPLILAERPLLDAVSIRARSLARVPLGLLVAPELRSLTLDVEEADVRLSFPRILPGLSRLQTLAICGWPLSEIPAVLLQLEQLSSLTLRRCALARLPEDWGRALALEHLDVSANELREIPASLAALSQLRALVVAGNPLTSLDPAVSALPSLARVDLDDTPLA